MISEALDEYSIARESFAFVPFPIETPMNLSQFLPTSIPILTTICEDWNREKISLLQSTRHSSAARRIPSFVYMVHAGMSGPARSADR
jgi:hypothetical protein